MAEIAFAPPSPLHPCDSWAPKASSQKDTSPTPNTAGCDARICSASEVPERGMPRTNTGLADADPDADADAAAEERGGVRTNRASNVAISLSMSRVSFSPSYTRP
jgi:hypothetical protein